MPRDTDLRAHQRAPESLSWSEYKERLKSSLQMLAPHLQNLPPEAQRAVIDVVKRRAASSPHRFEATMAGAGKAAVGFLQGIADVIGIGATDPDTGMRHKGLPDVDYVTEAEKQQAYEDKESDADAKPFLTNLREGSSRLWEGVVGLPGAIETAERNDEAMRFGQSVGEASARDMKYLLTSPGEAIYRDPTRLLDVAPATKAAGAALRAGKALAGAKGFGKAAKAAGAAAEFVDPGPSAMRSVKTGDAPIATPEASRFAQAQAEAIAKGVVEPDEARMGAKMAGAATPTAKETKAGHAPLELSKAERAAQKLGKATRFAALSGVLASDAIGPAGALAVGAAAPFAADAARLAARQVVKSVAKSKHGVSLDDSEADAALRRQVVDPNAQVDPAAEHAVRRVVVDPIHERQAIQTMSSPLVGAVERGDISLGDDKLKHTELRRDLMFADGGIYADQVKATAASDAYLDLAKKRRAEIATELESKTKGAVHRARLKELENQPGDNKDAIQAGRRLYRYGYEFDVKDRKAQKLREAELEVTPTTAGIETAKFDKLAADDAERLAKLRKIDAEDRELRKQRGLPTGQPLGARVASMVSAANKGAASRKRLEAVRAAIAEKSADLLPKAEAARELHNTASLLKQRLRSAMEEAPAELRKDVRKAVARYLRAEKHAAESLAMERLYNQTRGRAVAAATAWKKGAPVDADVLLGAHIMARDAGGKKKLAAEPIGSMLRGRGEKGKWSLREAGRELKAKADAAAIDMALEKAIGALDETAEARSAIQSANMSFNAARLAETELALAGERPRARRYGARLSELELGAARQERRVAAALASDGLAAEAYLRRQKLEEARGALNALRSDAKGKRTKLSRDDAKYVSIRKQIDTLGRRIAFLSGEIGEAAAGTESVHSPAGVKRGEFEAARAASKESGRSARKTLSSREPELTPEQIDEGMTPEDLGAGGLTVKKDGDFPAVGADFYKTELGQLASGIARIIGDQNVPAGMVGTLLTKSLNKTSMLHALNPRVVGKVSNDFLKSLRAAGVSDEAIMMTDAYKRHRHRILDRDKVGTFLRRQVEETIVEQIQKSDVLGDIEPHLVIELPDGSSFDISESVEDAIYALDSEGVPEGELLAGTAKIAFDKLAEVHLERQTRRAVLDEALRSVDPVTTDSGLLQPAVGQVAAFLKTYAEGTPGNIVLFDARRGSADLQQAFGVAPSALETAVFEKYGLQLPAGAIEAAKNDLLSNFIEAPPSLRDALAGGFAEEGVRLGSESSVFVRFGYGQSVGTHLDYLRALGEVGTPVAQLVRGLKRGLTVGSTGAMVMNLVSNSVLISTMTGRPDVLPLFMKEAKAMRGFETNAPGFGPGTPEGMITEALLKTGIGDSSMAHEFKSTFFGPGSTKGAAGSWWDAYWSARTGIYKQVDAVPKMMLARGQMKRLLSDVDELRPGEVMSLDQGGGNRAFLYVDDAGNRRIDGQIATPEATLNVLAKQATRSASAALFDFNDTGLLLKSLTKNPGASTFNELGAWFLKAMELPGKQGIVSTAAFFDPSSAYITNSPRLLAKKAKSLAALGARRHALLASARAVGEYSGNALGPLLGFEGGSTVLAGPKENDDGRDVVMSDMTSGNWMMPALGQAEALAMLSGSVADLVASLGDGYDEDKLRVMAAGEMGGRKFRDYRGLSGAALDKAVLVDRMLVRQSEILRGDRDLVSSVLAMMQFTGGLTGRATSATDMDWQKKVGPLVTAAFLGADGAALVPFKIEEGQAASADPNTWTEGQEDYFRYAMSGMLRFVGREKNSSAAIASAVAREKSALRKNARKLFAGMDRAQADLNIKFLSALIEEEGERATDTIRRLGGVK